MTKGRLLRTDDRKVSGRLHGARTQVIYHSAREADRAMAKRKQPRMMWVYSPHMPKGSLLPEDVKREVALRAQRIVDEWKPKHIKKPPKNYRFNYITDLYTKWHRQFFYFCATYTCPSPDALSPTFESCFTRIEYVGKNRFNLAYMRHTGKWWTTEFELTPEACFETIRANGFYHPI